MPRGLAVEKSLQEKNVYFFSVKPKLEKLLNFQSSTTISAFTKQKLTDDVYFHFFMETLRKHESHSLRERICREDALEYLEVIRKEFERKVILEEEYNLKLSRWSQIVYVLLKHLPGFMARKIPLMIRYFDHMKAYLEKPDLLEEKPWNTRSQSHSGPNAACEQFVLTLKILVAFVSHHMEPLGKEKLEVVFALVDLGDLKICYYLNFIKLFFKKTIPLTFSPETKSRLFLHYLSFFSRDTSVRWSKVPSHSNEHYLKQVSYVMNLPILSHIFETKSIETSFIFDQDVIAKIKGIISPSKAAGEENEVLPTWALIDLTVLFDYLLCKIDLRALRFDLMQTSQQTLNEFLQALLLFSWKMIVRVQEISKLLINLSKLVVTRIKSRSTILDESMSSIFELFTNVLHHVEDIVDEDNKNIWLNICDVLLPEIQANNDNFDANGANGQPKKPSFWFEEFLRAKDLEDPTRVSNKDAYANASRWWIVLFRNRALVRPQRLLLLDNLKLYTYLGQQLNGTRVPFILLDIFLVFITWYVQDYRQCVLEGKPTDKIYGLSVQKEEYLIKILIELIKRDDDGVGGGFLNRAYFLFRFFYLFIGKTRLDYDVYKSLIDHWRKKNPVPSREEVAGQARKRFRVNFVLLNISLAVLHHPKIKEVREKEAELLRTIYEYVMKELQQKYTKDYVKYPYLIPLGLSCRSQDLEAL